MPKQSTLFSLRHPSVTQTRPFQCAIPDAFKAKLQAETDRTGIEYGVFFSTSGKALTEHVNPTAHYAYLFRTIKPATLDITPL